jgi:hypothetical protein
VYYPSERTIEEATKVVEGALAARNNSNHAGEMAILAMASALEMKTALAAITLAQREWGRAGDGSVEEAAVLLELMRRIATQGQAALDRANGMAPARREAAA